MHVKPETPIVLDRHHKLMNGSVCKSPCGRNNQQSKSERSGYQWIPSMRFSFQASAVLSWGVGSSARELLAGAFCQIQPGFASGKCNAGADKSRPSSFGARDLSAPALHFPTLFVPPLLIGVVEACLACMQTYVAHAFVRTLEVEGLREVNCKFLIIIIIIIITRFQSEDQVCISTTLRDQFLIEE
jgi:hypothetical protein